MKKTYIKPEFKAIEIKANDIIATSGPLSMSNDPVSDEGSVCDYDGWFEEN